MFLSPSASLPLHQSLAFFSQECGLRQCALGSAEGGCGHTPVVPASSKTSRGQQIDPNLHTFSLSYSLPAFPFPRHLWAHAHTHHSPGGRASPNKVPDRPGKGQWQFGNLHMQDGVLGTWERNGYSTRECNRLCLSSVWLWEVPWS